MLWWTCTVHVFGPRFHPVWDALPHLSHQRRADHHSWPGSYPEAFPHHSGSLPDSSPSSSIDQPTLGVQSPPAIAVWINMLYEPQQTLSNFKAGIIFIGGATGLKWREETEVVSEPMLGAGSASDSLGLLAKSATITWERSRESPLWFVQHPDTAWIIWQLNDQGLLTWTILAPGVSKSWFTNCRKFCFLLYPWGWLTHWPWAMHKCWPRCWRGSRKAPWEDAKEKER